MPPPPIRELRDLTRARTIITRERTREIQRLEKLLEDACIKLSSVASDITGVSGRLMLKALIEGHQDPAVLANLAQRRMRSKIPELTDALTGRFSSHHRYMAELYLHRIDAHTADIEDLSARIEAAMEPFRLARELLISIPGFSTTVAEIVIAETGADMTEFPTASPPGAGRPKHSSRSNTPCSPQPGTCSLPANSTKTPAPTTPPARHRPQPRPAPSDSSNPSATKSPSNPSTRPYKTSLMT
ncbi:transposase [Arthrobacter sp. UYEF21]